MAQKRPKFAHTMPLWSFWAKYWHFLPISPHARPKNNQTRCLGGFSGMWVPNLLLPLVKVKNFGPKKAKFGPQYAFSGTYWPCRFIWCPVGWWLWRAGYLARHLFTLFTTFASQNINTFKCIQTQSHFY